jgi:hypothetical protein
LRDLADRAYRPPSVTRKVEHMEKTGFAVPILPGKEELATEEVIQEFRRRMPEYEQSRANAGLTMERVFLQKNPDDSSMLVIYGEAERTFEDVRQAFATSGSDFDEWFLRVNQEVSGIDFRQPSPGGAPEHVASWEAPSGARGQGLAFAAPIQPGKTDAGRAWSKEAFGDRKKEMTESRLALGSSREEVFVNQTPQGDVAVIYIEGEDPIRANREFAASNAPYDRWFKDNLKEIFPPFIDFDQPVPTNETLWDWSRS